MRPTLSRTSTPISPSPLTLLLHWLTTSTPLHSRYAYNLVLHHHGDLLYNGVCETVRAHLEKVAAAVAASPDHNLLADLSGKWNLHKVTMGMIRDILMYMVCVSLGGAATRVCVWRQDWRAVVTTDGPFSSCAAGPHLCRQVTQGKGVRAGLAPVP